jgi:hypothetical protein
MQEKPLFSLVTVPMLANQLNWFNPSIAHQALRRLEVVFAGATRIRELPVDSLFSRVCLLQQGEPMTRKLKPTPGP